MIHAMFVFTAQAVYVFLLGFQSRNVRDNQFVMAAMTSTCLGICGLTGLAVVVKAVQSGEWLPLIAYVAAGPVGICSAMAIHNQVARQKPIKCQSN